MNASGGARVDLRGLAAPSVEVDASGGASVSLWASTRVAGDASEGSNVYVFGGPAIVDVDESGGANVSIQG